MANEQNLRPPFPKGVSGNPAGRPPGIPNAKTRYQRILTLMEKVKNPVTGEIEEFSVAEIMDMKIMQKARNGDLPSYKEILDRLEGRAAQDVKMEHSGTIDRKLTDKELDAIIARASKTSKDSKD